MNIFTRRKSALISVFIAAALAIAVACGGDDAPVAAPKAPATAAPAATAMMAATAVPAATAMPAATAAMAATAMPAATAVPAPTAMPAAPTATAPAMMQGPANPERYGGNLTVSLGAAISTLDVHRTTGTTANTIAYAVQEFLFAYNEQLQAQPLLIDTWETSSDGLTWDFKLRDGLKFHNEKAVTSEDAVQSWIRWAERDNYGSLIFGFIDDIYTTGDLTFQIEMVEPTALVLEGMARIGGYYPYVMPPEMYNVPAADGASVLIGTGPYKYEEWIPGDHLLVSRYDDYLPVEGEFSFMAGEKIAYFDTVNYVVVPDTNARIAALRTGEIDVLDGDIPGDFVNTLADDANLTVQIFTNNSSRDGAWLDNVDGPFADGAVRKAFAMAYPVEDALRAAVGDERFWDLCPSMMVCGGNKWGGFDDFSDDVYNVRDTAGSDGLTGLERAKKIIEDKGLVGSSIIVLQAADRPRFSGPAEISRQTLEELGFDVEFKVTDWATQTNWREKPELWDVFHTAGGGAWGTNPLLNSSLAKNKYWNKYQDESGRMTALTQELARATSADDQLRIVKEMQEVFWNDIPYVSFGDTYAAAAYRANIEGVKKFRGQPFNVFNSWRSN
jgi:peptide/nickel transport system substrate-binding protein